MLFAEPEPVVVLAEIPEGPPVRFTWRRVTRRVVKAEGPERIAPEWWLELMTPSPGKGECGDGQRPAPGRGHAAMRARPRDYYRIEDDDGRRYWVFRAGLYEYSGTDLPAWFLHGVFG
jgi:protein ImuB